MRHILDCQNGLNNLENLFDHISSERMNDFKLTILKSGLLKQSRDMCRAFDEEERLAYANNPFLNYFCLTTNDRHRNAADLLSEKSIEILYTKHIDVLTTAIRIETHQKVEFADGTDVTFAISIFRIETNTGLRFIGGIAIPIPAFNFEKQLREANERILLLNRATTHATWEGDMKTGNIFRNDTLINMIGYSSSRSKGLSWWLRRIHPEDRDRVSDKVKEAIEKGLQSWEGEYRIKCSKIAFR